MKQLTKRFTTMATIIALSLTASRAGAQSIAASVNAGSTPVDEFWTAASVGWFYTPTTSFSLLGVYTQFFATGGTDRNVTVELLTAPRADGGALLGSGVFNTSSARGVFGGATFASAINLVANTQYFLGFRNMAPPGAGDFSLVPESDLLPANYTGDVGASMLSTLRFDFDDDGQYLFDVPDGFVTQPMLQLVQQDATTVAPEPGTVWMLIPGLLLLFGITRYRTRVG
ncbi:MAG: hypothetical protein ABI625_12720 [bacterium]